MAGLHGRAATVDLGRPGMNGTHTRQTSDIDSLSPELLAALQSTFGGKLSELRSQASLEKQKSLQPPPQERAEEVVKEEEVEEIIDSENEGAFLVIAYVAGILSSLPILLTAGGGKPEEDVSCKGFGDSKCVQLYGYILPIGVTGISLLVALVISIFDVSFGVYNLLKTTENFFLADTFKLSHVPQAALSYIMDMGFIAVAISLLWLAKASTVDPLFTLCEEGVKVFWTFGLITMGTVIFGYAAKSIKNPESTHHYMRRATKIVIILMLCFGASSLLYNTVAPPQPSRPCQLPEAAEVNGTEDNTQLQLYYRGWLNEIPDPESKQVQLYSEAHQFDGCPSDPLRKDLPHCKPRARPGVCEAKDDDLGMCPARYDQGMCAARYDQGICEARYDKGTCRARDDQGMCEARYDQGMCKPRSSEELCHPRWRNEMCEAIEWGECEWPWLKRVEVYERKDKCRYDLPVCDWPLVKRIQIYESPEMCQYDCPSCDWPLVKRIQVYSRGEQCGTLTLPECDWPYLKQIQRYEGTEPCYWDDRLQCDWPFLKQIQPYEPWNWCSALHYQQCYLAARRVETR